MSELRVSSLKNASSATTNITLDASGNATVGGTLAMGSSFLRNRIINGAMRIAQRGTSFSVSANAYTLDRWLCGATGGTIAVSQVAAATPFTNAIRLTGGAGVTSAYAVQRIESVNIADLAGLTVTIQANILASSSQTIQWAAYYPTATDNYTSITLAGSGTFSVTTSAATYSAQLALNASAANGLQILFYPQNGGAFTSGTVDITGVQLEVGSVATPFERRQYGQELALCQRYYYRITTTGTFGDTSAHTSTSAILRVRFPVTMRTSPTALEQNGTASNYAVYFATTGTASSSVPSFRDANADISQTTITVASGLTVGQAGFAYANAATAYLGWSAEL